MLFDILEAFIALINYSLYERTTIEDFKALQIYQTIKSQSIFIFAFFKNKCTDFAEALESFRILIFSKRSTTFLQALLFYKSSSKDCREAGAASARHV